MSNAMRNHNPLLVLLTCVPSIYAWMLLPELERYPIHWNIHGEADGFGSKAMVGLVLALMPLIAIFTHGLMWGMLKIDSIKTAIDQSGIVYDVVWHGCLWFFLVMNILIAGMFLNLQHYGGTFANAEILLLVLPFALGIFFVIIGNVLGKAKQNKFVGVKTPWTFKSKSTWEATHRFTAKLWVGGGFLMMLAPFIVQRSAAIITLVSLVILISFAPILYSYIYYQSADDKTQ